MLRLTMEQLPMADDDFWKRRYQDLRDQSASKETAIATLIQEQTGKEVREFGFAAGSADFLSGSADSHGHTRDAVYLNDNAFVGNSTPNEVVELCANNWIEYAF